jgi:hypothetical protein
MTARDRDAAPPGRSRSAMVGGDYYNRHSQCQHNAIEKKVRR